MAATPSSPRGSFRQYHQGSYRAFIPYFCIDSKHLRAVLQGTTVRHQNGIPEQRLQLMNYVSSTEFLFSVNEFQHDRLDFITECDVQVEKLFAYVERHLSRVEQDLTTMLVYDQGDREEPRLIVAGTGGRTINSDGGAEENLYARYLSPRQLKHLKHILLSLQRSLHSSFAALSELAAVHDENSRCDGRSYVQSKEAQKVRFEHRINASLLRIDQIVMPNRARFDQGNFVATKGNRCHTDCCYTLLHALLFCLMWGAIAYMYYWDSTKTWVVLFRLIRGPLLVVSSLYLFGINIHIWARSKINYISVFGFPMYGIPTAQYIFGIAGAFTMLYSVLVAALLFFTPFEYYLPGKVVPLAMWLSLLAFLVNPLDQSLREGRKSFLYILTRILLAPFSRAKFGDIWLAIQINNMVIILLDIEYSLCYMVRGSWTGHANDEICTTSVNGVRPIIASLPTFWLCFQSLRCYYDSNQARNVLKAIKFASAFPIVICATLFSVKVPPTFSLSSLDLSDYGWILFTWLLFSVIHAAYTFIWDVYCDWGLLKLSQGTLLRPKLMYKWKYVYYLAIILNLILQSTWTLELTLAIAWHVRSDLIYTALIVGEMLRSFMWNCFRVEQEHVR